MFSERIFMLVSLECDITDKMLFCAPPQRERETQRPKTNVILEVVSEILLVLHVSNVSTLKFTPYNLKHFRSRTFHFPSEFLYVHRLNLGRLIIHSRERERETSTAFAMWFNDFADTPTTRC